MSTIRSLGSGPGRNASAGFFLFLLAGLVFPAQVRSQSTLLLAPDPERVRAGNAFYEVVDPPLLSSDRQRTQAFADRRALEQADSLRLEDRFREQQHLVQDQLDVLEGLRKELKRSRPDLAGLINEAGLDSIRTFMRIEQRDSLQRARLEIDLAAYATLPSQTHFMSEGVGATSSNRSRPEVELSGVNGPLIQQLRYLELSSYRLQQVSVKLVKASKKPGKWREEVLKRSHDAVEQREYHRANHLARLAARTQSTVSNELQAFLDWTGQRSGDVHPEELPWHDPPVSGRELVLPSDTLLRPPSDVCFELGATALTSQQIDEAERWLKRVRPESEQGPASALLLAKLYRGFGRSEEARDNLSRIVNGEEQYDGAAADNYAQVLIAYGELLAGQGELQAAVDTWRRVDRHSPHHPVASIKASWVALNRGNVAAVNEWAGAVAEHQPETLLGYEASILLDLASGDTSRIVARLQQLAQLDAFLVATHHLEASERLQTQLDQIHNDVVSVGTNEQVATLHRLVRLAGKLKSASQIAAQSTIPAGIQFDVVAESNNLHPFEADQLQNAEVREAELMELLRESDILEGEIQQRLPLPPDEDWQWEDRLRASREIRDQMQASGANLFKAAIWNDPLVRIRKTLRTTLLFEDHRYHYDPMAVPSREQTAQAASIANRIQLLLATGDPTFVEVAAQGLLWQGDLLRMASMSEDDPLRNQARSCYQRIDSLNVPVDLTTLAFDRIAALSLIPGDHRQLLATRAIADTVRTRFPASTVLAHVELLAAESWLVEKRPQFDDALELLTSARYRPSNTNKAETLYLAGWSALRLHQTDRATAIRAFDQALMGREVSLTGGLRSELVRELAGAFAPPFVGTADDGFREAYAHFHQKWNRVQVYGFEFYWRLGDLYLTELGDDRCAQRAFDICRRDFSGEVNDLVLAMTEIRIEDRQGGTPQEAFIERLDLAKRWHGVGRSTPALDSLATQRLIEAVSLAASELSRGGDSTWVANLNEATDLLPDIQPGRDIIARALFLRAATLERYGKRWTTPKMLLQQYRTIALRYPDSPVAAPAMERAYALLFDALDSQSGSQEAAPLNPAELTHIALLLADRFPSDPRTPSLLLHAAARTSGLSSDALLDTIAARFPGSEASLNATKLWFQRKLASKRYEEVSRRALELLAESSGRRLREVAAGAYAEASYELAQPYADAGDVKAALQLYRRGADVGKGSELAPTLLYRAGLLAAENGRTDEAREFFKELVEWYPDSPQVASASFNLALTMGQLKGVDLLDSPDEAGPEEIAHAFEDAWRSDSTSAHAASFLANAAENYRIAGEIEDELRNRLHLLHSYPQLAAAYGNAVRALEIAEEIGDSLAVGESAEFVINAFPDSAQAIVALYRLGMQRHEPAYFHSAVSLQEKLEAEKKPGLPAYADAAHVALVDLESLSFISWNPVGQLIDPNEIKLNSEDLSNLYENYKKYTNLPSMAGVLAQVHLACLLGAQGQSIVDSTQFDPTNPGSVERIAAYESALERSFALRGEALGNVHKANQQLAELDRQNQQVARNHADSQQRVDPFGIRLLDEYIPDGMSVSSLLVGWADSVRTGMSQEVLDAAEAYHLLASQAQGDPLDHLLVQLEGMRNIISPRLAIATGLRGAADRLGQERNDFNRLLLNRLPRLFSDRSAELRMENTWTPRLQELISAIQAPGRKSPAVLHQLQVSADSLNDIQDAIVSIVDEGTLLLAQVRDSLSDDPLLDSLLLDRAQTMLEIASRFDKASKSCGRALIDLDSKAGKTPSKAMQIGQALLRDQERAWENGAIRVLESSWVLIDLDRLASSKTVHQLARELVKHDPAGYANLFDLPRMKHVLVSDANWYYTVDGSGVLDRVSFEQGRWDEPNPGEIIPKMIQASFPGDTLIAETTIEMDGLVVAATLEITASCRYEVFVNGSYVAESMHSPDLTGIPEVWELRTQLNRGHNSVRIFLADDRPVGMMARIIYTTIPEPQPGMALRTESGYGGRE